MRLQSAVRHGAISIALLLTACASAPTSGPAPAPTQAPAGVARVADPAGLETIAWMEGTWATGAGPERTEETWTAPAGGTMLGVGREVTASRTRFFEFLRIEARADGVFYFASPAGREPTQFRLIDAEPGLARFENPDHDFPNAITYRRMEDGSALVRVEGTRSGQPSAFELHFHPVRRVPANR